MAKANNPKLGSVTCETCHQIATVHQMQTGKGRYLYTKGCECKYNGSTGATRQRRLWHETQWEPGANPIQPPNVIDSESNSDFDPDRAAAAPAEPEPSAADAEPSAPLPAAEKSGGLVKGLAAVAVGVAVFILTKGRVLR